jgi:DNA polymerase type B, organellar and viral
MIHKYISQTKLILSFFPLLNHTIHYTELQDIVSRGMIMSNVTQVMEFEQKAFLREFVETFTRARAAAQSETKKSAFKLMINATFGRFGLNCLKFVNVYLALSRQEAKKYGAKHNFKSSYIVNPHLSVFSMRRICVKYRKHWPIAAAILAISKTYMYQLYYNRLLTTFPDLRLLSTDTDCFVIHLFYRPNEDDLVNPMRELRDIMDFSNLNEKDPLYSLENASRPGALKNETGQVKILGFCISSPKKYFMNLYDPWEHESGRKVASKGIPKIFLSRQSFNIFRDSILKANPERIQFNSIRGVNMDVATLRVSKVFLSPITTHRYVLDDMINTLPFGHPEIPTSSSINSQESEQSSQSS